jgi:hypothetical protein
MVELGSSQYFLDVAGLAKPEGRHKMGMRLRIEESLKLSGLPSVPLWKSTAQRASDTLDRFSKLPPELRDMIIWELSLQDLFNLLRVSHTWRAGVQINAPDITPRFLHEQPLPLVVADVSTPRPSATAEQSSSSASPTTPVSSMPESSSAPQSHQKPELTLRTIERVRHGHETASKLAIHISKWMGLEQYDLKSRVQQKSFQKNLFWKMRKRLLPSLFGALVFLEEYPTALLKHISPIKRIMEGKGDSNPYKIVELDRMGKFSNELLLQTHLTFLILFKYLDYLLRFPSYKSTFEILLRPITFKRSWRHRKPLDKGIHSFGHPVRWRARGCSATCRN